MPSRRRALAPVRLAAIASVAALLGCTKIPPGRSAIDAVHVRGARALDEADVTDKIATAPTEKFLGLFRGVVYDYQVYDPTVLQRDLARVERIYRGKGFLDAHARAARVDHVAPDHVAIEIVVEEGPPTLNHGVRVDGLDGLPTDVASAVRAAASDALPIGDRFDEDAYAAARVAVKRALTDRGYAFAAVTPDAALDPGEHTAEYTFAVRPGPPATFGAITLTGLDPDGRGPRPQAVDEAPVRRALGLTEGAPYSTKAIDDATQSLLELEIFSAVEITPSLPDPPPPDAVVPITVRVEPTRLRQLRLGGGAEFDEIKTDVHLVAGWEDHDFLGGLRDFSVDFKPGAVLYPTRLNHVVFPERLLPEERLRVQLRQPSFLEARTTGFVRPELNVFPLLVDPDPPPNAPVVGYREIKAAAGVDRPFGKLFVSVAHNVQVESPFAYVDPLDPALRTLVLSYPQLITTLDLRDDPTHPHAGIYLGNDLQIGGGPFGGDAGDFRVQPEVRGYVPLGRRVTFASRGSFGLLYATNYGDVVQHHLAEGLTAENRAERVRDMEIVYFRGFFSGGPSSNRGYPLRGIAPHGVVPFLNPATASQQIALQCNPDKGPVDPQQCSVPIGGFTLWEWSNEVRVAISGPLSTAVFCDASDVAARASRPRFDHLHLSCGVGVRYDTPVGPLRLDVGYRVQPLQVLGFKNEIDAAAHDPTEGTPPRLFGVLPIAVAFGIGEAY